MKSEQNRVMIIGLIAFSMVVSSFLGGCNGSSGRWSPDRDSSIGITAKQGYAKALDGINNSYSGHLNGTFLIKAWARPNDVTKSGRARNWGFSICILDDSNRFRNVSADVWVNGAPVIGISNQTSDAPSPFPFDRWTVDSSQAMQTALGKRNVTELIKNNEITSVERMELSMLSGKWTIKFHADSPMDEHHCITITINAD